MSAKKEKRSARSGPKYKAQRLRTERNKIGKCKRHVANHPNDSRGKDQLQKRLRGD